MIHTIVKSVIHNYILLLHGSPKHIADKLREMWSGNDFPQELKETLTVGFSNDVLTIIKSDPSIAMLADTYLDNLEKSQKYAIPGLVESGVVIAALFLLRSHIKIKKRSRRQVGIPV